MLFFRCVDEFVTTVLIGRLDLLFRFRISDRDVAMIYTHSLECITNGGRTASSPSSPTPSGIRRLTCSKRFRGVKISNMTRRSRVPRRAPATETKASVQCVVIEVECKVCPCQERYQRNLPASILVQTHAARGNCDHA